MELQLFSPAYAEEEQPYALRVLIESEGGATRIELRGTGWTFGRALGNSVVIPSGDVSQHALLLQVHEDTLGHLHVSLADAGSGTPKYVNGQLVVRWPSLRPTDRVSLGALTLSVESEPVRIRWGAEVRNQRLDEGLREQVRLKAGQWPFRARFHPRSGHLELLGPIPLESPPRDYLDDVSPAPASPVRADLGWTHYALHVISIADVQLDDPPRYVPRREGELIRLDLSRPITLGRCATIADVSFPHPSVGSHEPYRLFKRGSVVILEDRSENGLMIDEVRVRPGEHPLRPEQLLKIGPYLLWFALSLGPH